MGFEVKIGGVPYHNASYSVQEDATPLAAGDSSGAVGSFSLSIPKPDPFLNSDTPLVKYGPAVLDAQEVVIEDTRSGTSRGKVTNLTDSQDSAAIEVSGVSRLATLNIYNVQAQPFVGTLQDAFRYYLSLASVTTDIFVTPSIALKQVALPGWEGELWFRLKQLSAALQLDISLVSGVILLRPIRTRVAPPGRDISRQQVIGGETTAQFVEAYYYQNTPITNKLVYPAGGWTSEVPTINVNSGEYIEEVLELSASLSSIQQPVMQTFVAREYTSGSVYTVIGDDGLPIEPAAWRNYGGRLEVVINPDTVSLTVKIQAPTNLPSSEGAELTSYSIALGADDGRYSTLRIIGTGVAFDKQLVRTPTGLNPQETGTEVGVTIDNPFLSTFSDVAMASAWAVRGFDGSGFSLSGSVTHINKLYDPGALRMATYQFDTDLNAGRTYAQVTTLNAGRTYQGNMDYVNSQKPIDYEDQVFGNVAGTRIDDKVSARKYRVRSGTITPEAIQFEAEDDTTHQDARDFYAGKTYRDLQTAYAGLSYRTVDRMGLR